MGRRPPRTPGLNPRYSNPGFLLIAGVTRIGWFLAVGTAAGPFIGYVLSRGPGLPGYTDDVGNWTEPLGLVSLVVEAVLFALAATLFLRETPYGQVVVGRLASAWPGRSSSEPVTPFE